ncbi:hypothetical protein JAAARDRAFT_95005, partial [Jaapia argillacea MUCL 33604]
WSSVFTSLTLVSNRTTPPHLDRKGLVSGYDILVSAGTHMGCFLNIKNLSAVVNYTPGTMIEICGNFLVHEVEHWEGGERLCFA